MLILVINCGSSSAKYALFDIEKDSSYLCRGIVERIGKASSVLNHDVAQKGVFEEKVVSRDHYAAIEIIKNALIDPRKGVIKNVDEVQGVGHRVVHGGEEFHESTIIDEKVIKSVEKYSELAPLHNPPSLAGIKSCMKIFKGIPQVAVFDTAFHQTMPECAYFYGIPYEYYEKHRIRKYGFHGTSHRYVAEKAAELLGRSLGELNIITVHLGNGCSISAVKNGQSVDTSMGFTPLEGLLMGTRSGDIDPAVVTFLMQREGMSVERVNDLLNKESGLLGVSGISNDMRDIVKALDAGDKRAKLAYDIFLYRIKKYIGAYTAVLGSVDAVVFTAGIGENLPRIKDTLMRDLQFLSNTGTQFVSIKTNEDLLIAQDTYRIVKQTVKR